MEEETRRETKERTRTGFFKDSKWEKYDRQVCLAPEVATEVGAKCIQYLESIIPFKFDVGFE